MLTGLLMFAAQMGVYAGLDSLGRHVNFFSALPEPLRRTLDGIGPTLLSGGLYLVLIRLSPLAGYHAAEHQVVHALERREPLLPSCVRAMPREHPRCGTNFVAAALLFSLGGALSPLIGSAGYVVGALAALGWWRTLGGWLQRNLTTRPATDVQLQSGIDAAKELLVHHARRPTDASPLMRLLRSGMVWVLMGFLGGAALLWLAGWLFPPLGSLLAPRLHEILEG